MSLLLVTAFGGMVLAAEGLPGAGLIATVILGGALASGGASALNHWLDRDIDRLMARTATRPVASERMSGRQALVFGLILNVLAFALLWWGANLLAALAGHGRVCVLRGGLHKVAQAHHNTEHRHWGRGGGGAAACWLGSCHRRAGLCRLSTSLPSSSSGRRPTSGRSRCSSGVTTQRPGCRCCRWSPARRARDGTSCCTRWR